MLRQMEGSVAVAAAIALCRPQVICAYPITPQTHIVERLGERVKEGVLERCEFINVESEIAALSVAIGACAAGARSYTATASQGSLFMAEAVYNAAGLGRPIVMTIGNRAIGAPINIWKDDHSGQHVDADAGWIQLYAETNVLGSNFGDVDASGAIRVTGSMKSVEASDAGIAMRYDRRDVSCPSWAARRSQLARSSRRVDLPARRTSTPSSPPPAAPGAHELLHGDDHADGRTRGVHRSALIWRGRQEVEWPQSCCLNATEHVSYP